MYQCSEGTGKNTGQELGSDPKTLGGKSQQLWKQLRWEPEDIKGLHYLTYCPTEMIIFTTMMSFILENSFLKTPQDLSRFCDATKASYLTQHLMTRESQT